MISFFKKYLHKLHTDDATENFDDAKFCKKVLFMTLLVWNIIWFIMPMICLKGIFFDVAENIEWGKYYQFGYDKHPFVSMWITRFVYDLTGSPSWPMYLLCQISIFAAVISVWQLALKIVSPFRALCSALLLLLLQYYSSWALEFNNDVIAISVWGGATLFFYNALTRQRLSDWLLTAFLCAVAVMTKYYAGVLFVSYAVIIFGTVQGRKSFSLPGIYLAALCFIAFILPNTIWLFQHDFAPFVYAGKGAKISGSSSGFLSGVVGGFAFICSIIERAGIMLLGFMVLFFQRSKNRTNLSVFNRFFVYTIAIMPLALTFMIPVFSGGKIKDTWLASCFNLAPLMLFMIVNPVVNRKKIRQLLVFIAIVGTSFLIAFVASKMFMMPYSQKSSRCPYETYPGQVIAENVTALWHERYGKEVKYVIGTRYSGVFFALYSQDQPSAFHLASLDASNWIDYDDVIKNGAVILWEINKRNKAEDGMPKFLSNLGEDAGRIVQLPTMSFPRLCYDFTAFGRIPRNVDIGIAVLPPRE